MWQSDRVVEQRITDAIARGELDDLPRSGVRLDLGDDALIPPEYRLAHRILRNAGYVPEEVQLRRQIGEIERLLEASSEPSARARAIQRLDLLRARLAAARGREEPLSLAREYRERILRRLERSDEKAR